MSVGNAFLSCKLGRKLLKTFGNASLAFEVVTAVWFDLPQQIAEDPEDFENLWTCL